jgi:sugar lactone lactonase YvrE
VAEATVIVKDGLTHTEDPRWHEGRLWFVDLYNCRVLSVEEDGSRLRTEAEVPGVPSGLGWLPDGRLLVVSMEGQQVMRREADGSLVTHADLRPYVKDATDQLNDMVVAADGTAYVGSYGFDLWGGGALDTARLMRVASDGSVSPADDPLHFPNGSTIVDGTTLVVAESFGNRLSAFDILADGTLSARRDWAVFGPVPEASRLEDAFGQIVVAPDGISAVDAEGAIWVADFLRNRALRVRAGGEIVEEVTVAGDLNCYAAALGGSDGRTLFLCATPSDFDREVRKNNPLGTVQTVRVDVPVA